MGSRLCLVAMVLVGLSACTTTDAEDVRCPEPVTCPEPVSCPPPPKPDNSRVGELVKARWGSSWWDAEIVDASPCGLFKVRYEGWDKEYDSWVHASDVQPRKDEPAPTTTSQPPNGYAKDDPVEIESTGTWYKGRVVAVKPPMYEVKYDDYDDSWNEWVRPVRLRPIGEKGEPVEVPGQQIEVEWGGVWYAAWVLETNDQGLKKIRYAGFGAEWDEWVPAKRVRPAGVGKK